MVNIAARAPDACDTSHIACDAVHIRDKYFFGSARLFDFVEKFGLGPSRMTGGATPRQDRPCCIDLAAGPRRGCGGMADAADSKSASRKGVGVQVPSPVPIFPTLGQGSVGRAPALSGR